MARSVVSKPFNNFVGGLITEATGLSYPENSAVDLDNVEIELSGLIRRRLGLETERGGQLLGLSYPDIPEGFFNDPVNTAIKCWKWTGAGGRPGKDYLVVQIGPILRIFDATLDSPSSVTTPGPLGLNTDFNHLIQDTRPFFFQFWRDADTPDPVFTPEQLTAIQAAFYVTPFDAVQGQGRMWFAAPHVIPFSLVYDPDFNYFRLAVIGQKDEKVLRSVNPFTGAVSYSYQSFNNVFDIRDFTGVPDGYGDNERRANISPAHAFNLLNQGWSMPALTGNEGYFFNVSAFRDSGPDPKAWPGNHDQVALGQRDDGSFDADTARRFASQGALAPKGNAKLYLITGNRDRPGRKVRQDTAATTPADPRTDVLNPTLDMRNEFDEPMQSCFRTIAFFGQRVWCAGDVTSKRPSGVYYSQVLTSPNKAGKFFSENSPTSPDFPDVLATDGGVIYIPEADHISKLLAVGRGILAFAKNGVWFIYGGEANFSALDQVVDKVSDVGTVAPESVISYEDQCYFWSVGGIHKVEFTAGVATNVVNVTDTTIRSFFQSLPLLAREKARAFVDEFSKRVHWLYAEDELEGAFNAKNRSLVLDLRTGAFTKNSFPVIYRPDAGKFGVTAVCAGFSREATNQPARLDFITTSDGTIVTDSVPEELGVWREVPEYGAISTIKLVSLICPFGLTTLQAEQAVVGIGEFYSVTYQDWVAVNGGENYTSYIETAPMLFEDLQRNKQATYVHSFFNKTEFGLVPTSTGEPEVLVQSGATILGKWNWHVSERGGRWSDPQVAYKLRRPFAPSGEDETVIDTGEDLVYTKRKVRGKGRALSLRYESVPGKDFQLAGFSIDGSVASE